ncbi:dihydrodipicolinate synthetase family protein [Rhizoctonia solani]|uniref:Dihydrodipicolinate synthetase family protein n=1 Tax=Rhizoctonia solani TaxID=456999 RepID=A0A8H8SZ93_9AGAM|nr:dihydrodipicolinate synthetase family protein [Rhizoctonia solani]QRW23354.1 dihydrodipicolinate synthetase family protein [Rhizoctonia solani]
MARTGPPPGIYVPTLCFFKGEKQEVDHETITKHVQRLARAGVRGLVANGTTGEPSHLSRDERVAVIKTHRTALDSAGFQDLPLIVGTAVSSTWETIEITKEAAEAATFFTEVADASPIPILLYNFPGVGASNGIDLDLNLISKLAKHPNIVGIKLSCGNLGKAARLTALYSQDEFAIFMGLAETLLHGLAGSGIPACVHVYDLYAKGDLEGAKQAQKELTAAAAIELGGGIPAMRYGCVHYFGYGGESRRPFQSITEEIKSKTVAWLDPLMDREK